MTGQKANIDIRQMIVMNGLKYYQVADKIGVTDTRFSQMMHREMHDKDRTRTINAIKELTE